MRRRRCVLFRSRREHGVAGNGSRRAARAPSLLRAISGCFDKGIGGLSCVFSTAAKYWYVNQASDGRILTRSGLYPPTMRHSALLKRGDVLYSFWSRVGDMPEHILLTTVDLRGDWSTWTASDPVSVFLPQEQWEGGDRPWFLRSGTRSTFG
jgi:hypothetical protein